MERHFRVLLQRYGEIVAVDLTDKVRTSSLLFLSLKYKSPMSHQCSLETMLEDYMAIWSQLLTVSFGMFLQPQFDYTSS